MKSKHKKLLISGVAAAMAGVLGVGALIQSSVSVQASAAMMPGIETIVKNSTEDKPFRILELVDTSEDAEIGYYISGQEPSVKLYEYQYQDSDGNVSKVHFSNLEEGLSKLPEKQRKEFAMNVKLKEDGSIDAEASTGIRKINDIADTSGDGNTENSPLAYSDYQEKYFLSDGESEENGWKKLDLKNFDGSARTDTVQIQGNYVESSSGDYTKQQQEYYPVRNDVSEDSSRTEKYRENIQNFYFSEGDDVRGNYYLQFKEVENETVNNALKDETDKGQKTILPEYDYSNGKYGYYENVYTDLTSEIVQNIEDQNYTFPGENPEDVSENAVLIQDNSETETQELESDSFDDGTVKTGSENGADLLAEQNTFQDETVQSADSGEADFGSGEEASEDTGDITDEITDEVSKDGTADLEAQTEDITQGNETQEEIQDPQTSEEPEDFSGEDTLQDSGQENAADITDETTDSESTEDPVQSRILGSLNDAAAAGSQADPYIYLGETIETYPFYKYTLIGDLAYIKEQAQINQAKDEELEAQGQEAVRAEGDITLADDQYWYWQDDGNGNLTRLAVSIVTGRQPVAYSDIKAIPEDFIYNYYYKVEKVWFCCQKSQDGMDTDPEAYTSFGWYYPSYPDGEDIYLKVEDGDGKIATHYISDAEYTLTPGSGTYNFVPGEGTECLVKVDHVYYQGGYTNHDWMKRYVFHLDPGDEEFDQLNIQVDTKKASDFEDVYAVQTAVAGQSTATAQAEDTLQPEELQAENGDSGEAADLSSEAEDGDGTEEIFSDEEGTAVTEEPQADGSEAEKATESDAVEETEDLGDGADSEVEAQLSDGSEESSDFEDGSAESAQADGGDTGILADYDLIYINGTLSETTAAYFKNSTVPCIINASKMTDDSVLKSTFEAFVKDTDADGHYVNHYLYFFKNTSQAGKEGYLVNTAFHTNFNPDAEDGAVTDNGTEGFEEILSYIESENKYRALGTADDSTDSSHGLTDGSSMEPLTTEISQARALEYIINYQYKRVQKTKDSMKVLQIMPAADCSEITESDVAGWMQSSDNGVRHLEIESVEACCQQKGYEASNMLSSDKNTWWHSQYNTYSHNGNPHYITVTLKNASDVNGFLYQSRSSGGGYNNGILEDYDAEFYNADGEKIGTASGTHVVEWEGTGDKQKEIRFGKTYSNVKKIKLIFKKTYHQNDENQKAFFAHCVRLGIVYDNSQNISIKNMTASEFVGHVDDIVSNYDMIYISGKKKEDSDSLITGSGDYRYAHVGSGVLIESNKNELLKLLGQLDNEYDQSYSNSNGMKRFAPFNTYGPDGGGYLRGSGNDMTKQQSQELLNFVKSGYPVVVSSDLLSGNSAADSNKVDSSSYYYSFINEALKYDNVFGSSELSSGEKDISFFTDLAKPVIKFDKNGGKPAEAAGVGEADDGSSGTIQGELKYTFTVENDSDAAPAISTYNCNLYIDLNFDGVFSEKEKQDKYMTVQDESGNVLTQVKYGDNDYRYELKMGQKYTVTRKIPSDYYKLITWKLEVVSNRNSYVHTSETGYSKQENSSGQKQTIRVLQLIPTSCTWTLADSSKFKELLGGVQDFNIEIESKTVTEINGYTQGQMRDLLSDKQMLIIGFADVYQDISNDNHQVDEILKFVKAGKSILFAHDTTSYVNYNYYKMYKKIAATEYGVDEVVGIYWDNYLHSINNVTWGLSLNTILRSVTGMDRYGITSNQELSNGMTVSQLLKKGNGLSDGSSVTFKELMEKAGDIAYKNGNPEESYAQTQAYSNHLLNQYTMGTGDTLTTKIKKMNEGAITQYPYKMADTVDIATTHGQYYQLGLEQDYDLNGNSDGKTDIVVWYTLTGNLYDKSPNDARNNYYLYSKGNVIYTGAGHSEVSGDEEIKLFINAIVAAANVTAVQPEVSFVKTLNPSAETETTHYYMTDQSRWTTGEANTLESAADLNINIKDYNMVSANLNQEDLDNQEMVMKFYIEDENGGVLDDTESNALPSELKNQRLTDITTQIGSLKPYGNEAELLTVSADGAFHTTQNDAYGLTVPEIEQYLRQTENDGTQDYRKSCKVWVKVTSTVYLYGEPKTSTVWSYVDLKQRQLFDMD